MSGRYRVDSIEHGDEIGRTSDLETAIEWARNSGGILVDRTTGETYRVGRDGLVHPVRVEP